ncbi:hypothetical protein PPL_01062 [Heterostelium album PN500]|uniref:Uncharacterized protein n=1 Tax=Heterostelium pallidum (strain ATCC 26659 / Pp 5 / PN500) TaxID=670386 RepID=D3AY04_HETP5|nr:hypothetical protein PPL_01062 [Heterostelium album PN500]EFA85831.1 hypothetical protein PPL_01062 [Heterostelium album PN500]|eukprot:XP_020437937.1 hypothetical protein PPL_01062 [Heterostelium album PN500]
MYQVSNLIKYNRVAYIGGISSNAGSLVRGNYYSTTTNNTSTSSINKKARQSHHHHVNSKSITDYLGKALTSNEKFNIKQVMLSSLHSVYQGREHLERGNFAQGEKLILNGFKTLNNDVDFSSSLFAVPTHALGLASIRKGDFKSGTTLFNLAIDRCKNVENIVYKNYILPEALNDLGLSLVRQKKSEDAYEALQNAEKLTSNEDITQLSSSILTNFGEYYKNRKEYAQASFYHGKAHYQLINKREDNNIDLVRCLANRAQVLRLDGDIKSGRLLLSEAISALRKLENKAEKYGKKPRHLDWAKILVECGHFHYAENAYDKARNTLKNAKDIFDVMEISNSPDAVINALNLAIIEKKFPIEASSEEFVKTQVQAVEPHYQKLTEQSFFVGTGTSNLIKNLLDKKLTSKSPEVINMGLISPLHFPLSRLSG